MPEPRIIAIDWSGAVVGARKKIWLAEARGGRLLRLESGRDRAEVAQHLIDEAARDPRIVVGLDFAFSLPAWFLDRRGLASARELWALADREAEAWIEACEPPFWGRPGRGRADVPDALRRTERQVPGTAGIRPKSAFQIGGAGAVGTGSLRGMPVLHRLSASGFRVWPFDSPGWPLVIEIYPRLLTGGVVKSSLDERAAYLAREFPDLPDALRRSAVASEDAFDAAVSALVMARHADELETLPHVFGPIARREGAIWYPHSALHPGATKDGDHGKAQGATSRRAGQAAQDSRPTVPSAGPGTAAAYSALLEVLSFAARKHRDQRRKDRDASPYINHPIRVAELLASVGGVADPDILQAALLHDTIEDTETTSQELERAFGPAVRALVEEVTDDKRLPKAERKRLQIEHAPHISRGARLIKIADKIANVDDITHAPPAGWSIERRVEYLDWTERVVAGCRGVNPMLERHYDHVLAAARDVLAREARADRVTARS